jgi:hypothetical protein
VRLIPSSTRRINPLSRALFHPRHCGFRRNPESDSQENENSIHLIFMILRNSAPIHPRPAC